MYQNVQVGYPIVAISDLIPADEFDQTFGTETRYLPKIMVEAGIVKSTSEVRRNRPDLCITFPDDMTDCLTIKWGKKFLFIIIGKKYPQYISEWYKDDPNIWGFSFDASTWTVYDHDIDTPRQFIRKTHLMINLGKLSYGAEDMTNSYILTA